MCIGCYIESGAPRIINKRVLSAADDLRKLDPYGDFHIVVDDWNLEDSHIEFCINYTKDNALKEIGRNLLTLSYDERCSALAICDDFLLHSGEYAKAHKDYIEAGLADEET